MYDLVAGKRCLKKSYYISKQKALELFPMLKKESLVGALIYYDGQHNDARMNLCIVLSAIRQGAQCANHSEVISLVKQMDKIGGKSRICGAVIKDQMTGETFTVRAKAVINACGPFVDTIRLYDNPSAQKIVVPSQGVHIVLPNYYSPVSTGLLDPNTSDGRVIFFLPWEKVTVAGTTDSPTELTYTPAPQEKDVQFILNEIRHYLSDQINVRRGDVLAAWAGLRPLVRDPNKKDTASLARNHIIEISDNGLITIAGGKWTTYRHMAEETIDAAVVYHNLKPKRSCATAGLLLEGGHLWDPLFYIRLVQDFGIEVESAQHLARTYGDRSTSVAKLCEVTGKRWPLIGKRLHEEFPYLEAEVKYAVREYALTAVDIISRRLRLGFLNTYAAEEALPRIVEIMANELKWDKKEQTKQLEDARKFLDVEMGRVARVKALQDTPIVLTKEERDQAKQRFEVLDRHKRGVITVNELRQHFRDQDKKIDERLLHELLDEVDLNRNGEIDFVEFLQLWSGLKHGSVTQSRFARLLGDHSESGQLGSVSAPISPERAGGGL